MYDQVIICPASAAAAAAAAAVLDATSQGLAGVMELVVQLVREASCFVALPAGVISALLHDGSGPQLPVVLQLSLSRSRNAQISESGPRTWDVAWAGASSSGQHLEVPAALASCIGLEDSCPVRVKLRADVPAATSVGVEPASSDDWEILEVNAAYLEEQLLIQVGVLREGQEFPAWIRNQAVLYLRAVSTSPSRLVRLTAGTELFVAPKLRELPSAPRVKVPKRTPDRVKRHIWRVQVLSSEHLTPVAFANISCWLSPSAVVFVSTDTASRCGYADGDLLLLRPLSRAKKKQVLEDKTLREQDGKGDAQAGSVQPCFPVRLASRPDVAPDHVMLSSALRQQLFARVFSRVQVTKCTHGPSVLPPLSVLPVNLQADKDCAVHSLHHELQAAASSSETTYVVQLLAAWLDGHQGYSDHCNGVPLACGSFIKLAATGEDEIENVRSALFRFDVVKSIQEDSTSTDSETGLLVYYVIDRALLHDLQQQSSTNRKLSVSLGAPLSCPKLSENVIEGQELEQLQWFSTPIRTALTRLIPALTRGGQAQLCRLQTPASGGLLLHGPQGCGKSAVAAALARHFQRNQQSLCHSVVLRCNELVGEQPEKLEESLKRIVQEAVDYAPSVVILDDLDAILPASEGGAASESNAALSGYLCELMDNCQRSMLDACPIVYLATSRAPDALAQSLRVAGRLDFEVELPPPTSGDRTSILAAAVAARGVACSTQVIAAASARADAYDAADMALLLERAVHSASTRYLSRAAQALHLHLVPSSKQRVIPKLEVLDEDFTVASKGLVPGSLQAAGSVQAASEQHLTWEDVGGLQDVRQVLQETLELPSRHASLFAMAPLRLRSGILLFGPPGCGKTHIVGVAAAACSLRFIGVKGPELLNKYIGASEQAVRDTFKRAAAAAPCILFFDEFDAIAPKRGHDNTGVTDRVVNQLLTELDGVEKLENVFVLAATSRPDLIDAALLRPGRLDRLVFCGFPSVLEREQILASLGRKLRVAEEVSWKDIARRADGFSGADLQALLSDAQLGAVHDYLEQHPDDPDAGAENVLLTMAHLRSAATALRPSVTAGERARLDAIYDEFVTGRKGTADKIDAKGKGKKQTLA
eukprot:jgi/Chlat1/57/ChrspC240389S00935